MKLNPALAYFALWGLLILALGAGCTDPGARGEAPAASNLHPDRPNVIVISIDTLRADHLSCYGYERATSPNLDRFAREDAILFEQVVNTGGGTLPVHMSMFTSLPPTVHDVWPGTDHVLAPDRVTLAEQLRDVGYTTAAFTGGGFMVARFGFDQGFDSYDGSGGDFVASMPKAFAWLEEHRAEPFFLFLHTYDVHSDWHELPYDAPDGYNDRFTSGYSGGFTGCMFGECASQLLVLLDQKIQAREIDPRELFSPADLSYIVGLYDGGIAYVDRELDRLFQKLKELGLYDDSVVIVTSDHGEEFLEHGLFLHHQNFEEIARVPMLLKVPRNRGGGRRVSGLVSTLDLMPTVLDLVSIPPNPEVEGHSVLPMISGRGTGRSAVYMAAGLEKLRGPRWSLVFAPGRPFKLFDLEADPGETIDLLDEHPDVVARMTSQYEEIRARQLALRDRLRAGGTEAKATLTPEEIERLRALGYLN